MMSADDRFHGNFHLQMFHKRLQNFKDFENFAKLTNQVFAVGIARFARYLCSAGICRYFTRYRVPLGSANDLFSSHRAHSVALRGQVGCNPTQSE